tara:strand:- start:15 stop:389 length:375 start_codon:yes stop_codon:yes gene_type:complete
MASSRPSIDVGAADQFDEGKPHAVRAGDRDLVIVRRGDEFFAVRDACPHQGARLSSGYLTGDVESCSVGEQPEFVRDGEFLACPWHGWKVDIRNGCSPIEPESVRVRSYDVLVDQGRVYVNMES